MKYSLSIHLSFHFPVLQYVDEDPTSDMVILTADDITNSGEITCSEDEKDSLQEQADSVSEAQEAVVAKLKVVLTAVETSVGSTPSSSDLASIASAAAAEETTVAEEETTAPVSTASARRRGLRKGFKNKLKTNGIFY